MVHGRNVLTNLWYLAKDIVAGFVEPGLDEPGIVLVERIPCGIEDYDVEVPEPMVYYRDLIS